MKSIQNLNHSFHVLESYNRFNKGSFRLFFQIFDYFGAALNFKRYDDNTLTACFSKCCLRTALGLPKITHDVILARGLPRFLHVDNLVAGY